MRASSLGLISSGLRSRKAQAAQAQQAALHQQRRER
jgi:hypothetical protein